MSDVLRDVALTIWIPFALLLDAWALAILWRWYIVPTFGMIPLSLFDAFGVSLIFHYLAEAQNSPRKGKDGGWWACPGEDVEWWVYPVHHTCLVFAFLLFGAVGRWALS